jgi:hypothetical protein
VITNSDGSVYKQELYYGQTYLSQSSRKLFVSKNTAQVDIYTAAENKRTIRF